MSIQANDELELRDFHPNDEDIRSEILHGLSQPQKRLPAKYFYDARGSQLFDEICELPEYYPTRTELAIMERCAPEMARVLGRNVLLIEFGSGSSVKTRILLDNLEDPTGYVPVDISREHLMHSAAALNTLYPELEVLPVCADFTQPFELPKPKRRQRANAVYFPGSTIGNFDPAPALKLLKQINHLDGAGGELLIGVDLKKDVAILEAAYNDAAGVTAAFNLNMLVRLNRELDADFDLQGFGHRALWNEAAGRIEMHLVSLNEQAATVAGQTFQFRKGETIHTENSHKYTPEGFAALAARAGFAVQQVWTDEHKLFSVQLLTCTGACD